MPESMLPDEFELIARHFAPLARGFPGAYGLLDDAAVITPAPGCELVVKTDTIVAGVDFPPAASADHVGRKALRVNLSDLAAKGARPRAYLLNLVLPSTVNETWVAALAAGLQIDQAHFGVQLIGGDTSSTSGPITLAVSLLGDVASGRLIRRGGGRPGDRLFVTGTIGDAALGLRALQGRLPGLDEAQLASLIDRYSLPRPRVELGPQLIGIATAAIDVSDGLVADLEHLCAVSHCRGLIHAHAVPLSPAARAVTGAQAVPLADLLVGGDDYEILFTAPAAAEPRLRELSASSGVAITAIGELVAPAAGERTEVRVLDECGQSIELKSAGWRHFGSRPHS